MYSVFLNDFVIDSVLKTSELNKVTIQVFLKYIYLFILLVSQGEIVYLLIYFPTVCNNWGWIRPKPGTENSVQVSHEDGRCPSSEPSYAASQEAGWGAEEAELKMAFRHLMQALQTGA